MGVLKKPRHRNANYNAEGQVGPTTLAGGRGLTSST